MEQRLWQTLSELNEWVRYADGKAVALLGIQGILIGLVVTFIRDILNSASNWIATTSFILGSICIGVALICSLICLSPRLKNNRISLIYFQSITRNFSTPEHYFQTLKDKFNTEEKASDVLSEQIYTNSRIASMKYYWVSRSTGLTVLGLVIWVIFLIVNLF